MKLTITIQMDNAAFFEGEGFEIERILACVSKRLPLPLAPTQSDIIIHDINGNYVGDARIVDD